MLIIFKKEIRVANLYKAILITASLLFSFISNAQEEDKKVTVTADTAEILQPPADEDDDAGVTDADKGKYFGRIWDTLRVQQRTVPADEIKRMKEDEEFWYANTSIPGKKKSNENVVPEKENGKKVQKKSNEPAVKEQRQEETSGSSIGQQSWFQTLIWIIIIGGFAAFLVIYLTGMNVRLFRKKNVKVADQDEELSTEDIFAINYQKEIDKAAVSGNHRLAIRLMFLRLLRNMSDKNIIRYKQDKTNFDYLMELQPTVFYNQFFRITRNYEYSWYGKFQVNEEAYQVIRKDFDQLEKELK